MLSSQWVKNNPEVPVQVKRGGPAGFNKAKYSTNEYYSSSSSDGENTLNKKKEAVQEQGDQ
ncbi:hypothetical protein PHLCEN_2v7997 [Hermanssonia centrifuga]|uniref:Uncharacterized protein n=1 Tax=Hermanssonia centrifuga TaxID=98765 RepID=A0A2R6NUY7_9APHY|nr:hypothetical protein PHLCEN_2v7997 [Hermanssonia centrifuga]